MMCFKEAGLQGSLFMPSSQESFAQRDDARDRAHDNKGAHTRGDPYRGTGAQGDRTRSVFFGGKKNFPLKN